MKLKDFNFNDIPVKELSVFVGKKEVEYDYIGEVLKRIPHLAEHEILSTNTYFGTFVIRLKGE